MPNNFPRTSENDIANGANFAGYVADGIAAEGSGSPLKTSAAISGLPQYAATSMSVSDILQGTFSVNDPSDTLTVINKALTQDLSALYDLGFDSASSFSPSVPTAGITGGAAAPGVTAATGSGSTLNESWVTSLPSIHPTTKAVLWVKTGKASMEMHLPTSADLATDVSQHKQYTELPPNQKHPWYMDRVGGPIGGETGKLNSDPSTGTILNESATAPGQPGAFGILSPEAEQFYISMAYPYKGTEDNFKKAKRDDVVKLIQDNGLSKTAYTGKRILVYSKSTTKGCVCTPGDWGPQPYWSNGASDRSSINGFYMGLSTDVHYALGTKHGDTMIIGWMPDNTPVGPYTAQNSNEGTSSTDPANTTGPLAFPPDATGSTVINTFEEMQYAGQMIVNHPNCKLSSSSGFKSTLTNGFGVVSSNIKNVPYYYANQGKGFLMPSLLNMLWYLLEGGYLLGNYLGSYGIKQAAGNASRLSYHAKGGAIDIGSIGRASENRMYSFQEPGWRTTLDSMFTYVSTLPKTVRAKEYGCSFEADYNNGLHIYKDAHPTHLHIGYDYDMAGQLMPALKKRNIPLNLPGSVR